MHLNYMRQIYDRNVLYVDEGGGYIVKFSFLKITELYM